MADDLTTPQEEISRDWFQLFMDNNWDPSTKDYRNLLISSLGKNGKFPVRNLTPKRRRDWVTNFDKQILALQQYVIPRNIPTSGWVWYRGDGIMGFLNDIAQQRCGVSGSLDSWNPMDIVGVKSAKEKEIEDRIKQDVINGVDESTNRSLLNGIMIEYIQKKELMPVSLKKIDFKERPAMLLSPDLRGRNARLKAKHYFKYVDFSCDLEWSTYKNEWKMAQEISWAMDDKGSVIRTPYRVNVQARAFQAAAPREKPQHSLAATGAGAMLGKSSIAPLDTYVKNMGFRPVPSPGSHRYIAKPGQIWTPTQKNYWIALYNKLKAVRFGSSKIDFGNPGSYGEGLRANVVYRRDRKGNDTNIRVTGFEAALESATKADEDDLRVRGDSKRRSGSRLTAKLWGMEWLSRYWEIARRKKFDSFAYQLYRASTKELPGMGPFIKIYGQTGRSSNEKRLYVQEMLQNDKDITPIYDPRTPSQKAADEKMGKKGYPNQSEIRDRDKVAKNIVDYESDDPTWEKLLDDVEFGEMRGL